jgi:histidine triad (HIT) family protein
MDCIFCKIVKGEIPSYKVYEDENFLAFLDIFPFIKGQALIIPKSHIAPFLFNVDDGTYAKLMLAAKKVASAVNEFIKPLKTGILVEGLELEHVHIKIFPLNKDGFKIVSNEHLKLSDKEMKEIAEGIRSRVN